MGTIPLKVLTYADEQRKIPDIINENFNLLLWLINEGNITNNNISGDYIYTGTLTADQIVAGTLDANKINVINLEATTVVTENLYAEKGYISELTVDQLDTSDKVRHYLQADLSDVNYIKIFEQNIQFITASTDGSGEEQATNRSLEPLYWIDNTNTGVTTEVTDYPVMIYTYTEMIKMQVAFEFDGTNYVPKFVLGAGSGSTQDSGKTFVYKAADGFYIDYRHSVTGASTIFKITDAGIDFSQFPQVTFASNTVLAGLIQLWVQADFPGSAKTNDVFIDTDDNTRYDVTALTGATTLLVTDNEVINASGTFTITLHAATAAGIIKKIYNVGTGTITLSGTINGVSGMLLFPGESVEIITDGSGWRY